MSGQEFTCSKGHDIYDPEGKIKKCPGYRFGSPCQGSLRAVGSGSRKINQKSKASTPVLGERSEKGA